MNKSIIIINGHRAAAETAKPEAKSAADYICDANGTDGVAKWLEENVS